MNNEQLMSFIRQMLLTLSGGLVTKGYMDSATQMALVGGLMAAGTVAWGLYVRRSAGLIASAAAMPNVKAVVTDAKTADTGALASNPKVVSGNAP